MKTIIFICVSVFVLSFIINTAKAQKTIDSAITIPMFSGSYMIQIPGGDMSKRYGVNSNIGGSFMLKLKNNLILDVNANYLFGTKLKGDASAIFDSIKTSNGFLINENGEYAKVITSERGYFIGARIGKVFSLNKKNLNSGLLIMIGGGLLQHKIKIENDGNNTPQILEDYKKGYDKMTIGFSATEFIGYMYFSKRKLLNFYIGIELYQGFTQSGRSYDFSLMKKDTYKRLDLLNSIKLGWVIPIYKRVPDTFYYN